MPHAGAFEHHVRSDTSGANLRQARRARRGIVTSYERRLRVIGENAAQTSVDARKARRRALDPMRPPGALGLREATTRIEARFLHASG